MALLPPSKGYYSFDGDNHDDYEEQEEKHDDSFTALSDPSIAVTDVFCHFCWTAVASPTKKVTFCDEPAKVILLDRKLYYGRFSSIRWLTDDQMLTMQREVQSTSKKIQKSFPESELNEFTMAFRKATLKMRQNWSALEQLPPTTPQEDLEKWCCASDGRRGLERMILCLDFSAVVQHDIQNSARLVLKSKSTNSEQLSSRYQQLARRSAIFAHMLGEADAVAASDVYNEQPQSNQQGSSSKLSSLFRGKLFQQKASFCQSTDIQNWREYNQEVEDGSPIPPKVAL